MRMDRKGVTNMFNTSFVTAQAMRSAALTATHTTDNRGSWHTAKPAFYAALYAGYEATWGSTR